MSLVRLIVWGFIFYIILKIYRSIKIFIKSETTKEPIKPNRQNNQSKLNIDTKDIIEAKFEEVKPSNKAE